MVLAAGRATRFGAPKQLVELDGLPLVAHAVRTAGAAGLAPVLVVVGHEGDAVAVAAARGGAVQVVPNPDHAAGQSTSLRAGLDAAAGTAAEVAVVLLADQPGIDPGLVRAVVAAVDGGTEAARARYDDGPGHPVALARSVWRRAAAVSGDRGARDLLRELEVVEVVVAGAAPRDVDHPADLADPPADLADPPADLADPPADLPDHASDLAAPPPDLPGAPGAEAEGRAD